MASDLFDSLRLELRRGCLVMAVLAQLRTEHYGYTLKKDLADFAVIAWVTIWAFVADWWLARSRVLETWDPKKLALPPDIAGRAAHRAMHDAAQSLRDRRPPLWWIGETTLGAPTTFRLVLGVALGVWWLVALRYPVCMFGPAAAVLDWGPDMDRLYPVLVVAQILALAGDASSLMSPADQSIADSQRTITESVTASGSTLRDGGFTVAA